MSSKDKRMLLQTILKFTSDGGLQFAKPVAVKPSKKSAPLVKKCDILPKPLDAEYRPPDNLNQYEMLDLDAEYDISSKLDYYPVMLAKIRAQDVSNGQRFPSKEYREFYGILDDKQSLILISLFKRVWCVDGCS